MKTRDVLETVYMMRVGGCASVSQRCIIKLEGAKMLEFSRIFPRGKNASSKKK